MPPSQGNAQNQQTPSGPAKPTQPPGEPTRAFGGSTGGANPTRGGQIPPWQREVQREPQTNLKRPVQGAGAKLASRSEGPPNPTMAEGKPAAGKASSGQEAQKPQTAKVQQTAPQTLPTQSIPGQAMPTPREQGSGAPTQAVWPPQAPAQQSSSLAIGEPVPNSDSMTAPSPVNGGSGVATAGPVPQREPAKAKASAIDGPTRHISRDVLPKDMPDLSEAKHPLPTASAEQKPKIAVAPQRVEEGGLRASVQIRRVDPWSTLKISSIISVSLFLVWMVAVGLLYVVLDGMGVWDRLNGAFTDIVADSSPEGLVTAGQVFGYAAVIGLANMVLFTALATIGSFIYNLCSDLVGGVEVTLADRD
ncbi:DUF3566 domain-containing protein [Rhodococcus sp. NPDC049939]|uniref:DUF3566 domain-containing protein n=1 Tax=Rhodococcus sp. NPDC049939 TaxID=3155511 RepID=UPI0033C9579D